MSNWHQNPPPGTHSIFHGGDVLTITLFSNIPLQGVAWLRTNLGRANRHRREIIEHIEQRTPILAKDWHDLPMTPGSSPGVFEVNVPLFETGRFEAKAFFLPDGENIPVWPDGDNLIIKVEPALSFCANSLYTAFVRQFGPNMKKPQELPIPSEMLSMLDANGFTIIPKSGTFRALTAQLDHIIGTLGFRVLQLLPIHPVPTTFARMGRFGSPFASIDFFDVDAALAEFDRKNTPLDQFLELVDGVHQRGASLFLDLPINHTGWASHLQLHHPDWFARNGDHSFASPGAWGVTWEDLSELDYRHRGLWEYMAKVFLFWCEKGVDGFRCDAGYMVPMPVWEYIVAKVRQSYPDTIFLLEGLGGKISIMRDLLDRANLNWAYSEIFQVYDRSHLEQEIQNYHTISSNSGVLINFAETHDNNRLAAISRPYARMRTALAALCSVNGAFGITNGVEWFAEAKVDVHGAPPLNWDSAANQIAEIANINKILKTNAAFQPGVRLRILPGDGAVLMLLREPVGASALLILINLDAEHRAEALWPSSAFTATGNVAFDLLSRDTTITVDVPSPGMHARMLAPGEILCLCTEAPATLPVAVEPLAVTRQRKRTVAMAIYARLVLPTLPHHFDPDQMAEALAEDPSAFCETISGHSVLQSVTVWQWPADLHRTVMLPARHMLLIECPHPFRAALHKPNGGGDLATAQSLPRHGDEGHFAFLLTTGEEAAPITLSMRLTVFTPNNVIHETADILQLSSGADLPVTLRFGREALRDSRRSALLTNGSGAMCQVRLEWGRIVSQYDAMLAANLDNRVPVDRRILFTRCRAWLVHMGYSYEIGLDCTTFAVVSPGQSVQWHFNVPAGLGKSVPLTFTLRLCRHLNRIVLDIARHRAALDGNLLDDDVQATLILRPDIEDRNFHETSKAYSGPEYQWPAGITPRENGFSFAVDGHAPMRVELQDGHFTHEPQWLYGVPHPFEAERGLESSGDLFSPGFFTMNLCGGDRRCLTASIEGEPEPTENTDSSSTAKPPPARLPMKNILKIAIQDFIVRRDDSLTVIAGYPWFLDWGRDTLICLRGIIASGMVEEALDILLQFARFEDRGTLPNMIRGNDDRNRDTSDAPLWFFTACNDLLQTVGDRRFLEADCKGRPLLEVLRSLAQHMVDGTPNGIIMDPESGLIFSPSHFTWMDTNYPAGTPREGYPIEIQALWHAALQMLARVDNSSRWKPLAKRVRESITTLYALPGHHYLADCLHAQRGTPASKAIADNALRPNQLLAVTLGALTDPATVRGILQAAATLLIPGAIRSLADQAVSPPLPITGPHGLLNDPNRPYWGEYRGDEDSRRKPAYHNGTAWTWPFPSYCEALAMHDKTLVPTAISLLSSVGGLLDKGCVGHLPEILDGNRPHHQRGCWAQAWGVTEAARVLKLLTGMQNEPRS